MVSIPLQKRVLSSNKTSLLICIISNECASQYFNKSVRANVGLFFYAYVEIELIYGFEMRVCVVCDIVVVLVTNIR